MKNKVLFIVSDFYHGGGQREMYELDASLNKTEVEITLLCLKDVNLSHHFPDYFHSKHQEQQTPIYFLNEIIKPFSAGIIDKVKRKLNFNDKSQNIKLFSHFLSNYNKIVFMGEYVYQSVSQYITDNFLKEITIFIMCGRFQGEQYRAFDKNKNYLFISPFDDEKQIAFEFEGFKNFRHVIFPLSFNIDLKYFKKEYPNKPLKKIGIFTRLNKAKPLDPFIYALHLLLDEMPNIELHVFGSGDFKEAEYNRYLNHLHLDNQVIFRGHQENIKSTCFDEQLDLIWFQGYKNRPAGYAGLDICLTGVPMLLWDFYLGDNPNANCLEYVYPHFKNLNMFVEASKRVLQDVNLAKQISQRQLQDVITHRDMEKNKKVIEKILF